MKIKIPAARRPDLTGKVMKDAMRALIKAGIPLRTIFDRGALRRYNKDQEKNDSKKA